MTTGGDFQWSIGLLIGELRSDLKTHMEETRGFRVELKDDLKHIRDRLDGVEEKQSQTEHISAWIKWGLTVGLPAATLFLTGSHEDVVGLFKIILGGIFGGH